MLWRATADAWSYAAYVWNEAQTDATLVPAEGLADVVEVAPGKRHSVPSRDDCQACHDNGGTSVLGFTALQLSPDRDPGAPHAEPLRPGMITLQTLLDERLIDTPQPGLFARAPRIPGDPRTRAALGYLSANCGHCHNADSTVATVRFPLRMPAYPTPAGIAQTIGALVARTNKWDLPHSAPGTTSTVKPGAPDLSALAGPHALAAAVLADAAARHHARRSRRDRPGVGVDCRNGGTTPESSCARQSPRAATPSPRTAARTRRG